MSEHTGARPQATGEEALDRDLSFRAILGFTLGLTVLIVVSGALMWWLSIYLRNQRIADNPPPPALPEARQPYAPPAPRLQTFPEQELREMLAEDERALTEYAWVDKEVGIAQIPIERAMELLVEQQSPPPTAEAPQQ